MYIGMPEESMATHPTKATNAYPNGVPACNAASLRGDIKGENLWLLRPLGSQCLLYEIGLSLLVRLEE